MAFLDLFKYKILKLCPNENGWNDLAPKLAQPSTGGTD